MKKQMFMLFALVICFGVLHAGPISFIFEDSSLPQADKDAITNDLHIVYQFTFQEESVIDFYATPEEKHPFIGYLSSTHYFSWPSKWKRVQQVVKDSEGKPALWISRDDSTWYTNQFAMLNQYPDLYPSMCAFIEKIDTKGRAGALTDEEAFEMGYLQNEISAMKPDYEYSKRMQRGFKDTTIHPSAKAVIQFYPDKAHTTGTVRADGVVLTNKAGNQTPNFKGALVFSTESEKGDTWLLIYQKGRWHLFYPEKVEDVDE